MMYYLPSFRELSKDVIESRAMVEKRILVSCVEHLSRCLYFYEIDEDNKFTGNVRSINELKRIQKIELL